MVGARCFLTLNALMSFLIYLRFMVFCLLSYAVFAIQLTRTADISLKDMCRDLV